MDSKILIICRKNQNGGFGNLQNGQFLECCLRSSQGFHAKIDSMCAAFLWKNKTSSAAGSRVAWRDVCRPKSEGGVGIRLLEDFQLVFRLKQAWNLFSNSGSLWVAWLKSNVFGRKNYWLTQDSPRLSPVVRSMTTQASTK